MPSTFSLADVAAPNGLISGPFGSNLVATDYSDNGVPVIRGANMGGSHVSGEFAFVSQEKFERDLKRSSVRAGDVVFTQRGTLGQVAVVPESEYSAYVVSQSQMGLRVNPKVADTYFVYFACSSQQFLQQISDNAISTGVPHINLGILSRLKIPQLPLDEQRAIAELLGALDEKIAANERAAKAAFEFAQSLVRSVLDSQDTLVQMKFGQLGQLFDGPLATPTRRSDGPYFLNISSLKRGRLDLSESDHVSEEDFTRWTRRVTPEAGDLLFSYETRIGEAALMPGGLRACLGRRMALLRPNRDVVDPVFLLHFYLGAEFQRTVAMHTIHGATVPRIGLATMPDWDIAVPDFEAQRPIAGALGSLHSVMVQAERESDYLARTRDELLPLLMSGKLRVKDAEAVASEVL